MTFAPRTWVVGEVVSAALMNQEIRDQFNSMFAAWTPYTPTWTGSTTNPVLGNGNMVGRYMKFGRTVLCEINLTTGSTTTYGSGNYSWTLPFQAANAGVNVIGNAQLLGTNRWLGQIVISANATTCSAFFPTYPSGVADTRASFLTQVLPETHAAGDQVRLTFMYEAAS
ncbi:hypothetical protein AB0I54_31645 [Streptomyces sp. NPDC050625]|uniref:hypothetical protein n=1 Tax=Streptomyces sp. NPDC050625 TaxID=3154629 RepID=UPI0034440100